MTAATHPISRLLLDSLSRECTFPKCSCPVDSAAECPVVAAFKRGQTDARLGRIATNLSDTPEGRAYAKGAAAASAAECRLAEYDHHEPLRIEWEDA